MIPPQPLLRHEWLAARRSGIGGSEAPALFGEHPWLSQYALWVAKTCEQPPEAGDSDPLWWGHALEPVIRARYEHEMGVTVDAPPTGHQWLSTHPSDGWLLASVDGLVAENPRAVLECKTALFAASRWTGDEPPLYTQIQVQQYLAVLGLDAAVVGLLAGWGRCRFFRVARHDAFIERLRNEAGQWWRTHIVQGTPPAADGSDATRRALRVRFAKPEPVSITLADDLLDAACRRDELHAMQKSIKAELQAIDNRLVAAMDGYADARFSDGSGLTIYSVAEAPVSYTRRAYVGLRRKVKR